MLAWSLGLCFKPPMSAHASVPGARPHLGARVGRRALLGLALTSVACSPQLQHPSGAEEPTASPAPEEGPDPTDLEPTPVPSPYFVVDGKPFCFAGANNYYLMYKPPGMVTSVLDAAKRMQLGVVRMWAFLDRGSLDGDSATGRAPSVPDVHPPGHQDGVYFQSWDPISARPAYNDGATGLAHLDFVLHEARARDLRLTLVLTNNWRDFGGMDQYLTWYGLERHHEFFTDARVRAAFKDWISHLLTRVNSIDGVPYRDDPAIFAWELANEPRAHNGKGFDSVDGWTSETLPTWADEMSAYIKSIDPHHLVAVGDEGFLATERSDWAYRAPHGVDSERLTALPHVDFGTYHLYPDHWGKSPRWGNRWILEHSEATRRLGKPYVLEEYGLTVRRQSAHAGPVVGGLEERQGAYSDWNRLVLDQGGSASLFWMLAGWDPNTQVYPDYDQFAVYEGDATAELLQAFARQMPAATACTLADRADHGEVSPFVQVRAGPRPKEPASAEAANSPGP